MITPIATAITEPIESAKTSNSRVIISSVNRQFSGIGFSSNSLKDFSNLILVVRNMNDILVIVNNLVIQFTLYLNPQFLGIITVEMITEGISQSDYVLELVHEWKHVIVLHPYPLSNQVDPEYTFGV